MSKVISGNFGGKTAYVVESEVEERELTAEELAFAKILSLDALWLRENFDALETLRCACEKGDQATDYIFSLGNFHKKNKSLDLRQDSLKNRSLKELSELLAESHELQWNVQPHYFGALILEMNERLAYLKEVLPEHRIPSFREE